MKIFTFLILLVAKNAIGAPNGLCILKSKSGGHGMGFIVANYLFSAAHVFESADGTFECKQGEKFVDITDKKTSNIKMHPTYQKPLEQISHLREQLRDQNPKGIKDVIIAMTRPYDLAYMELKSSGIPLQSDFILDPSLDIEHSANFQSPLGSVGVIRIKPNGRDEMLKTVHDISAVLVEFKPSLDKISITDGIHRGNAYLEYDMSLGLGDSGSPVILPLKEATHKFLVVGLVQGTYGEPIPDPIVPHSKTKSPTVISPAIHLSTWLREKNPELFLTDGYLYEGRQICAQVMDRIR